MVTQVGPTYLMDCNLIKLQGTRMRNIQTDSLFHSGINSGILGLLTLHVFDTSDEKLARLHEKPVLI